MEHVWNILNVPCGTSVEHPWNIRGTLTPDPWNIGFSTSPRYWGASFFFLQYVAHSRVFSLDIDLTIVLFFVLKSLRICIICIIFVLENAVNKEFTYK